MTEPIIRDERLGRFKSAQRLVDAIRELDRQIRLTEESGMTVDQAVMVMSVLDTAEPDIQEVIASVITKLSGTLPDKDPDPTPDTPDHEPEPEPETPDTPEPETPDEPESNEETPVEAEASNEPEPLASEDSETASVVDESSKPEPETPEESVDTDRRTIEVEGCIHPVTVTKDGEIFIDGEKQEVLYNTQGYAFLKLPGEKRLVRAVLHSLVMQAFRPTTSRKQVVHKNGNQRDCRLENLAYRDEIKVENQHFDASDALEASVALVDTHFNVGEAVKLLGMRKKRASYDLVRKIMNKEIFTEVSDRYFDAHLHVVRDMPKETEETETTTTETTAEDATAETETTTTETVEEIKARLDKRKALIRDALARCNNDLRKAYNLLRKEGYDEISIFMVFNVKNHEFGHGSDDDIMELIRYAKKMGLDIRYTLLKECDIDVVPERMLKKATRR